MKTIVLLATVLGLSSAYAEQDWSKALDIQSVEVKELPFTPNMTKAQFKALNTRPGWGDLSEADKRCAEAQQRGIKPMELELSPQDLAEFIKVGKEIWKIVEANRPVFNVNSDTVSVIPMKMECWRFLENWKNPVAKAYRMTARNGFGMNTVDFTYKVIGIYGGSYRGKGKYLARVTLVPEYLEVAWGYTFNATVSVPSVLNFGTMVDPVAGAEVELTYSIDTVLKHFQSTKNYVVKGNGEAFEL